MPLVHSVPEWPKKFESIHPTIGMAKFDPPDDFDEVKKRGGSTRHIVKRISDSTSRKKLDSNNEENILDEWINQIKPDGAEIFDAHKNHYPPISRLDEYVVVTKEVEIGGYRLDSVIRCPEGQPDGYWKLVEVKTESELGPGVIGHLITKEVIFKNTFTVRDEQVGKVILANNIPITYRDQIGKIENSFGIDVMLEETDEKSYF